MNKYAELRAQQQKEIDEFPFMWAFSQKQFEEGMIRLGLSPSDTDKIYSIGAGGYIRKTDSAALHEMMERHAAEMQAAVDADKTGEGFVYDMFRYELDNHEYSYTRDLDPTLDALGLTLAQVMAEPKLRRGLSLAKRKRSATPFDLSDE